MCLRLYHLFTRLYKSCYSCSQRRHLIFFAFLTSPHRLSCLTFPQIALEWLSNSPKQKHLQMSLTNQESMASA